MKLPPLTVTTPRDPGDPEGYLVKNLSTLAAMCKKKIDAMKVMARTMTT